MSELPAPGNSYHNVAAGYPGDVPLKIARFVSYADAVLVHAAELARVVTRAHQGAATQLVGGDWAHARKYFSLSEKYAAWADYDTAATGVGIHAYAHRIDRPLRLTDEQLRSHPEWRGFGDEAGKHPPLRGWLVCPLLGGDQVNYGFIQASDRVEGDFTECDESNLVRLAGLTATALDSLAQVHIPSYRPFG
jgi:GAF domain-containing protein